MSPLELTKQNKIEIKLWEKIELEFREGEKVGIYTARVEDLSGNDIIIDRPTWKSGQKIFSNDGHFSVTLFRDDCTYRFDSKFSKRINLENRKLYVFSKPEYISRMQRRSYVRINTNIAVDFALLEDLLENSNGSGPAQKHAGFSVNFSASGMLLNTKCPLKIGDVLVLTIDKNKIKFDFPVMAIVRRIIELPDQRVNAGIEYVAVDQAESFLGPKLLARIPEDLLQFNEQRRQNLIQFVFYYQINLRKKGLV